MVFVIFGNLNIAPGKYDDWQAAFEPLGDYVWKNESTSTLTYYFGVPPEYAGNMSASNQMLAFEMYGKREDLYKTHFHSEAMGNFLKKIPPTMTTGLDLTHYEDVDGSFLDKPGDSREAAVIYDSRIKCHPGRREVVVQRLSALARSIELHLEDTWTFMVLKSLDNDHEVRVFQRSGTWEGAEELESYEPRLKTILDSKDEIASLEGRAFVPNKKGWLHR
ncbi:hypothetical protein EDD36DRAFT_489806 [Exophiala viscosa]|uniref:ABM domain-containing protein n=1 Tax=Exophiala viscosa TaxID=2486360 RepID=A0AAN6DS20_9EURO|nr:hypothetical protein EDD36DRAFT_489806 [Exophiala viscosa]